MRKRSKRAKLRLTRAARHLRGNSAQGASLISKWDKKRFVNVEPPKRQQIAKRFYRRNLPKESSYCLPRTRISVDYINAVSEMIDTVEDAAYTAHTKGYLILNDSELYSTSKQLLEFVDRKPRARVSHALRLITQLIRLCCKLRSMGMAQAIPNRKNDKLNLIIPFACFADPPSQT